jgi:hypothetical protein
VRPLVRLLIASGSQHHPETISQRTRSVLAAAKSSRRSAALGPAFLFHNVWTAVEGLTRTVIALPEISQPGTSLGSMATKSEPKKTTTFGLEI